MEAGNIYFRLPFLAQWIWEKLLLLRGNKYISTEEAMKKLKKDLDKIVADV